MDWKLFLIEGLVITFLGSLLHFVYDWSKKNKFVAFFAAVNESTWEHIKLALSSIFFLTLVDVWFLSDNPNYWLAKSLEMIVPIIAIPAMFYGYRAILKVKSCLPLDIGLFVVASFLSSLVFAWVLTWPEIGLIMKIVVGAMAIVIFSSFLLLTKFPIYGNEIFRDPITGKYGTDGEKRRKKK